MACLSTGHITDGFPCIITAFSWKGRLMHKKYDDEKNIEKKYGEGVSKVKWCHHRRRAASLENLLFSISRLKICCAGLVLPCTWVFR